MIQVVLFTMNGERREIPCQALGNLDEDTVTGLTLLSIDVIREHAKKQGKTFSFDGVEQMFERPAQSPIIVGS